MIELQQHQLIFRFPEVHAHAVLRIEFQRTLRIPDDDGTYPLPPGLGRFPVRHVDDFAAGVPSSWIEHGGVMLPMYQSEALWLNFGGTYPCAVKVATGKIDAVTGKALRPALGRRPQNYLVVPDQPWLDGYCVEKGIIRQFVAMPLGAGYTAEEQLTGEAEHGGLQLVVHPMRREAYERMRAKAEAKVRAVIVKSSLFSAETVTGMGLAPGGRMRQEIFRDPHALDDWDHDRSARCFVHLANSLVWRQITGEQPPTVPPTATEYAQAGLPWFEYYDDARSALAGSAALGGMKSVAQLGAEKGDVPLAENAPVSDLPVIELRKGLRKGQVREGRF